MKNSDLKERVEKELKRTTFAFSELKIKNTDNSKDLFDLAKSYFDDAKHFYQNSKYFESFELLTYLWGILDSGARLGLFNPGKAKKHFKIEQ